MPPEVGSLSASSAHCIIESYMTAVKALKERKEWFLSAVALHELGMVYCYQGDRKSVNPFTIGHTHTRHTDTPMYSLPEWPVVVGLKA